MPLRECMQKHTHRELLAWLRWLREDMNNPSRSDYYLMAIASEIEKGYYKDMRKAPELNKFKITFYQKQDASSKLSQEQTTQLAKARWFSFLRIKDKMHGK